MSTNNNNEQIDYEGFFNICDGIIQNSFNQNGAGNTVGNRFEIISECDSFVKRFNIRGKRITFSLVDPPTDENIVSWFKNSIADVVNYITNSVPGSDQVGLVLNTPSLEHGPAWMSFRRADQLHNDVIWDMLIGIQQSNRQIFSDGQFTIELTQVSLPVGRGKHLNGHGLPFSELCRRKHGIIEINNIDNLCLPRAIVVADSWLKKENILKDIIKDKNYLQTRRAQCLLNDVGINIPTDGSGLLELNIFQRYLNNYYNIVVYEFGGRGQVIFEGVPGSMLPRMNLLHYNHHFAVIKSLSAAFSSGYFCEPCHKPYNRLGDHKCDNICLLCFKTPPCSFNNLQITCAICNLRFRGQQCYNNHLTTNCNKRRMCKSCFKVYGFKKNKKHICGEIYCKICNSYMMPNHNCYIQPNNKQVNNNKLNLFIYYDFETKQEKIIAENVKLHEVNLCVAQQSCSSCCNNNDVQEKCNVCGTRQHIFDKDNPVEKFVEYTLLPRPSFNKIICIAHNAKSFDAQFILKYLVETMNMKPKVILNGNKILLININYKIRFIDSINYFMMPLSALPKAMDLPSILKKGYFPHLFNTEENKNYTGLVPETKYYSMDTMSDNGRKDFLKWHTEQIENKKIFNMKQELVDYCISDVDILRRSCDKFRQTFLENCSVCPFSEAVTIASSCNLVFRRLYLQPNTIGIIPIKGYRSANIQSKIALQWLISEEITRGIYIEHSGHGKEIVLGNNLRVDGYYAQDKIVFEFHGCFYHGCEKCFKTQRDKLVYNNSKVNLNSRLYSTNEKTRKLRELGYEVVEKWECEFNIFLKSNKDFKKILDVHPLLSKHSLNPRDAFFGGRSGNIYLHKKCDENEKIKYVDYCSLYPYICKYGKFPVGHPKIYVGDECQTLCGPNFNIDRVEGLIKCKILPPNDLFHPVLPRKVHGKLMFSLCYTCCEELIQEDCSHSNEEKQFIGTWVTDEIKRAIKLGYKIIEIYEIWQYKITQYDRISKTGGLFVEYINKFLKIKQEASGYPLECIDSESKTAYIAEYAQKEGISLNHDNITKNAGRRAVAKLALNSFWGKFAQTENRSQTSIISTPLELYEIFSNPAIEVQRLLPVGESSVYVNYKHQIDAIEQLLTVNVVIAAYVTAQARLRLYDLLEPLGERIIYYDTDSIFYSQKPCQWEPPVGNFLGDLTDELAEYGQGSYINEMVCGGPKNYAYQIKCLPNGETKQVCKVKGVRLNYKNSQQINFDVLKNLILNAIDEEITISSNNIITTAEHSVVTRAESKKYRINFMKRKRIENFSSLPYGFKKIRN